MSRTLTAKAVQAIDRKARDKFGISTLLLMENAGSAVAREVFKLYRPGMELAVFCGKGNNGGDGLVAARHLMSRKIKPDIFLACSFSRLVNEAKNNLDILLKLKAKIIRLSERSLKKIKISKYHLLVDALLGVGVSGELRGIYPKLIELINSSRARIISVDVPSGLDATTGKVLGGCVKADKTVTFIAPKRGMLMGDGPKYCGKVIVEDLGIPLRDDL
jgi:NAD(P)H-hydrate epimerase